MSRNIPCIRGGGRVETSNYVFCFKGVPEQRGNLPGAPHTSLVRQTVPSSYLEGEGQQVVLQARN